MRVVGPGSTKKLTAQEIDARVESELLFLVRLEARGELSDEEKRKRLTDLAKWSARECSKLPAPQAVEKIIWKSLGGGWYRWVSDDPDEECAVKVSLQTGALQ